MRGLRWVHELTWAPSPSPALRGYLSQSNPRPLTLFLLATAALASCPAAHSTIRIRILFANPNPNLIPSKHPKHPKRTVPARGRSGRGLAAGAQHRPEPNTSGWVPAFSGMVPGRGEFSGSSCHSGIARMAFSPKNAPQERFAARAARFEVCRRQARTPAPRRALPATPRR